MYQGDHEFIDTLSLLHRRTCNMEHTWFWRQIKHFQNMDAIINTCCGNHAWCWQQEYGKNTVLWHGFNTIEQQQEGKQKWKESKFKNENNEKPNKKIDTLHSEYIRFIIHHSSLYIRWQVFLGVFIWHKGAVDKDNKWYWCLRSVQGDECIGNTNFCNKTKALYISRFRAFSKKIFCLCYIKIYCLLPCIIS